MRDEVSTSRSTYRRPGNSGRRCSPRLKGNRKLTVREVRVILAEYHFGAKIAELHQLFPHVDRTTIGNVCRRKTWRHVNFYGIEADEDGHKPEPRNLDAELFERRTR